MNTFLTGQLRLTHYPQVPCKPFTVYADSLREAKAIQDALSYYDLFLLENKHRVDFANTSSISIWDPEMTDYEGEAWIDIENYDDESLRALRQEYIKAKSER